MASKALLLVLASFLLISTKVSSEWREEILTEGSTVAPTGSPNYKSSPPPLAPKTTPPPSPPLSPYPPPPVKASPPPPAPPPVVQPPRNRQECTPLCTVRCKNHSRQNVCMRACLACCERCKCVPPGQYGNKEKCGKCYSEMTTHGGLLKCP